MLLTSSRSGRFFLFFAFFISPLLLRSETEGIYTYYIENGKAVITGSDLNCSGGITIPSTLGGYPVVSILNNAFSSRTKLTSISVPNSVTNIGNAAFAGCSKITGVTLPASITRINQATFDGCSSLAGINIPSGVTSIGNNTFLRCTNLTNVTIPSAVTYVGQNAFGYCSGLKKIVMTSSTATFGSGAFSYCTKLTSISLPGGVYSTGGSSFYGCTSLAEVSMPDGVTEIAGQTFMDCTGLTRVSIPESVTRIGVNAFAGCTSLGSVRIPRYVSRIDDAAFSGCPHLELVFFEGQKPGVLGLNIFNSSPTAICCLPEDAALWGSSFQGHQTTLWLPHAKQDASFGLIGNRFGFNISWASGKQVVVETCDHLGETWNPVVTNTIDSSGSVYFSDPSSSERSCGFYRARGL